MTLSNGPTQYHRGDKILFIRRFAGRKQGTIEKGTEGRVFWAARQIRFGYREVRDTPSWAYEERVGIELPDGRRVFIAPFGTIEAAPNA